MEFRFITADEMPRVEELWDCCFEKRDTPFFRYYFQNYAGKENIILGAWEQQNEKLLGMLHLNPYTLRLSGQEISVPYIVGVAVTPEARGRHLMRDLLQQALTYLRRQKIIFVTLMPVYAGLYQPYDFAYCYNRLKYTWLPGRLSLPEVPAEAQTLQTVKIEVTDWAGKQNALAAIYDSFIAGLNGAPLRQLQNWRQLLLMHQQEQVQLVMTYNGSVPCGYAFFYAENKVLQVQELVAQDTATKRSLLSYLEREKGAERVEWLAEPWDKTYLQLADQGQYPQLAPFIMGRCLDARAAWQFWGRGCEWQKKQDGQESFVVEITDELLPENNGRLEICLAPCFQVSYTKKQPDLIMSAGILTQLLFGIYTAEELQDEIVLQRPEKFALLVQLFKQKRRTWNNAYV